jgi:hypothetical protein
MQIEGFSPGYTGHKARSYLKNNQQKWQECGSTVGAPA